VSQNLFDVPYVQIFYFIFYFPGLDGLPLPPPPALGIKVLDSWEYQQSVNNTIHVQLLINTLTTGMLSQK